MSHPSIGLAAIVHVAKHHMVNTTTSYNARAMKRTWLVVQQSSSSGDPC